MTGPTQIPSTLIPQLLQTSDIEEQTVLLREADFLHADGLLLILDEANRLVGDDPATTHSLTLISRQQAIVANAPQVVPRANYLAAYVYAMRGEFDRARTLLDTARGEYIALGSMDEALSVNVGLSTILIETGDFQTAIATCQEILDTLRLEQPNEANVEQRSTLAAKAYQNRGICHERLGQYVEALAAYTLAEEHYYRLDMKSAQADILINRGLVLQRLGQVQSSLPAFEQAESIYAEEQQRLFRAQALINIGESHLLLSNYTQSIDALEEAHRLLDALDELVDHAILLRHMGDAYLALNLHGEALDAYQKAIPKLESANLRHDQAHALWGMGVTLAPHQPIDALIALTSASDLFRSMNNVRLLSAVQLEQVMLLEQRELQDEAKELARLTLEAVENTDWAVQHIYALMRNADLAEAPDVTKSFIDKAIELSQPLTLPQVRYRLDARLGRICLQQGEYQLARHHLEQAVTEIQQLRNTLVQERMRASFLADKMMAFEALVQLHLDQGDLQQAFAVAEQAKSRALVDLLSGVIATQLSEPSDAETAAQLQELRAELDSVYNELLNGGITDENETNSQTRSTDSQVLSTRAAEIEREISRLNLRMEHGSSSFDKNSLFQSTLPESLEMDPDQALFVYHTVGAEIMAFVRTKNDMQVVHNLCTIQDIQRLLQRLSAQWERFRADKTFITRHMAILTKSTQRILHDLYLHLVEPVVPLLDTMIQTEFAHDGPTRERSLIIVPHGLLHQLPFHALYDGERYLIDCYSISYAPSATVFSLCQQRQTNGGSAMVLGIADEHIPAAESEVQTISHLLRQQGVAVHVLTNRAATREAFTSKLSDCGVLHMACHGLFRKDNSLFSALKLYDGWLTAVDAIQLKLDGTIVVLRACESGRSQVIGGDESIGMTYGMLGAGASSLLVSQWLAQDETTAMLMQEWYAQLGHSADLATALQSAQLRVKELYPHPYYWAPFVLIGQRTNTSKA